MAGHMRGSLQTVYENPSPRAWASGICHIRPPPKHPPPPRQASRASAGMGVLGLMTKKACTGVHLPVRGVLKAGPPHSALLPPAAASHLGTYVSSVVRGQPSELCHTTTKPASSSSCGSSSHSGYWLTSRSSSTVQRKTCRLATCAGRGSGEGPAALAAPAPSRTLCESTLAMARRLRVCIAVKARLTAVQWHA